MKKAIFLGFAIVISGAFIFVAYDMLQGTSRDTSTSLSVAAPTDSLSNSAPEPENDTETMQRYSNDVIAFNYPTSLTLEETPDGAAFLNISSDDQGAPFLLKAYLEETASKTAAEYFSDLEMTSFGISDIPEGAYFHYVRETYNDLPVMIHKRDFGGMVGEVNEMYVWLGNGRVVKFYAEPNHPALDTIFRSVSRA